MTRTAKLTLEWADGEYDFKLGIGELEELESATRRIKNEAGEYAYIGPIELHRLLRDGTCLARDIRQTIRIGLIGGGAKPAEASRLVKRYVDELPDFLLNRNIAALIVGAALAGFEIEPLGKELEAMSTREPTTDGFPSPPSTQTPQ